MLNKYMWYMPGLYPEYKSYAFQEDAIKYTCHWLFSKVVLNSSNTKIEFYCFCIKLLPEGWKAKGGSEGVGHLSISFFLHGGIWYKQFYKISLEPRASKYIKKAELIANQCFKCSGKEIQGRSKNVKQSLSSIP